MSLGAFSSLDAVQEYMLQCERRSVALYRNLIWRFCGIGTPMSFRIHLFSFVLRGRGSGHSIQAVCADTLVNNILLPWRVDLCRCVCTITYSA